jgi:hypothetical protein
MGEEVQTTSITVYHEQICVAVRRWKVAEDDLAAVAHHEGPCVSWELPSARM